MSPIPSIPPYDRVTSETMTDGVKITYYWSRDQTFPVHTEREYPRAKTQCSSVNCLKDQQNSGWCPVCGVRSVEESLYEHPQSLV